MSPDITPALPVAMARVSRAVASAGLDGALLLGLENVQFVAHAALRSASSLDRPNLVLVQPGGVAILYTSQETVPTVQAMVPGVRVRGYDERGAKFPDGILDEVVEDIARIAISGGRIGFESDRMPVAVHNRLRQSMASLRLIPFDDELRQERMVKQPDEIATIANAAHLTEVALARTIRAAAVGDTERTVANRLIGLMQAVGFTDVDPLVGTGVNAGRIGAPTERPIAGGDWLRLDVKSRYQGYFYTDAGRVAFAGQPGAEDRRAYRRQLELNRRIAQFMGPGVRCGDVYEFAGRQSIELGAEIFNYGHIGIGHGIGVGGTERPVLHERDDVILRPGMVINIEPDTYGPSREILHIEDMLLITDDGTDALSHRDDWSELPRLGSA